APRWRASEFPASASVKWPPPSSFQRPDTPSTPRRSSPGAVSTWPTSRYPAGSRSSTPSRSTPPARCSSTSCATSSPNRPEMDLRFSDEDEAFRREVRDYLETNLAGDFADARGLGGPGREEEGVDARVAWERDLAGDG